MSEPATSTHAEQPAPGTEVAEGVVATEENAAPPAQVIEVAPEEQVE